MQSLGRHRRFYQLAALSMIAAGSAMLLFSVWDALKPRAPCHDIFVGGATSTMMRQGPCVDQYGIPQSSNFIPIILSISLMAFGGAIVGMIVRF